VGVLEVVRGVDELVQRAVGSSAAARTVSRALHAGAQRGVDVEVVVGGADHLVDLR
jgi:hypothetical protein